MENPKYFDSEFLIRTKLYSSITSTNTDNLQLRPAVEFNLPYNSKVSLVISDIDGRKVITLINNKYLKKGFHQKELDLANLPGGEYFYKLETENNNEVKKLQLIK